MYCDKTNDLIFHNISSSCKIINHCIENNIGTIVVGYNEGWKNGIKIGKKNNQNFVSIPFLKFVQQLEYKGEMAGIEVKRITEEYTSQTCSNCGIVKKSNGKHRGLYVCYKCGSVLNADVNASKNIIRKGVPNYTWIEDRILLERPAVLKFL